MPLTVLLPETLSALEDVTVQVELPDLAQRDPAARVWTRVIDSHYRLWWESDLTRTGTTTYSAATPLHLPLASDPGDWLLTVFVQSTAPVSGVHSLRFRPEPVALRDLAGQLREGVTVLIPWVFITAQAEGDQTAGGRVWKGAAGEVGLWWVPGPAEALTQDTAQMMAEATHPTGESVQLVAAEAIEWKGLPAYRFSERWSEGSAEAVVVQGSDRWLYLLRVRGLDGQALPPLLLDIQGTFEVE